MKEDKEVKVTGSGQDDEQGHQKSKRVILFNKLIDACKRKDLNTIKRFVDERAEVVNLRDKYNRSLLHYAVILVSSNNSNSNEAFESDESIENNLNCFNYVANLCDGKLFYKQDLDGLSILHLAVISSNLPLVRHILFRENQAGSGRSLVYALDNERHSPLHWAVITNQLQCVKWLIERGGVQLAHERDLNYSTPLHYATQTRDYPKYRKQLRRMLDNVVSSKSCSIKSFSQSMEEEDSLGCEALDCNTVGRCREHYRRGDEGGLEILEFLVGLKGINLECLDKDQRTPLLWAASSGNRDAILVLLRNGANTLSTDSNQLSALHCAASHGFTDCVECLLGWTAGTPEVNMDQQLNKADNLSCTPLFYAILSGNIDCLESMIEKGAEKNWQDLKGRTGAHFAALKGQLNSLKLLHERGANLWLANKQGDLPLHYAVKSGRKQVVVWLLEHSPYENSVNAINNFGRAPIHIAIMRDNLQMTEFLIQRGANLDQLVKIKSSARGGGEPESQEVEELKLVNGSGSHATRQGSRYHYETALDMARNLNRKACMELLVRERARFAKEVIAQRDLKLGEADAPPVNLSKRANLQSLFDLQTADGPSPIGFETSISSNESPHPGDLAKLKGGVRRSNLELLKMKSPTKVPTVPQTDSTASSALSQSSETFVRGLSFEQESSDKSRKKIHKQEESVREHEPEVAQNEAFEPDEDRFSPGRPYKGGISYNNKHMNASIKCKLYGRESHNASRSFPPVRSGKSSSAGRHSRMQNKSLPNGLGGQEIITNVNVYTTSPLCRNCGANKSSRQERKSMDCTRCELGNNYFSDDTSNGTSDQNPSAEESDDYERSAVESQQELVRGGGVSENPLHSLPRHLPPSQSYERNLPVILSDREERTNSAGTITSNERSPGDQPAASPIGLGQQAGEAGEQAARREEEPRFDRFQHQRSAASSKIGERYRSSVKSPVADYIRSTPYTELAFEQQAGSRSVSVGRSQPLPDFSRVKPKVDTRRGLSPDGRQSNSSTPFGLAHLDGHSSNSMGNMSSNDQPPRSLSRQTVIKTRRLSVDSVELATSVERSIRKYKQETKLFEELQNLKRSQIRSGKANEALLVKRLVEHFHNSSQTNPDFIVVGLEPYHGPYTYKSYERYLYDQLRKLSESNRGKLSKQLKHFNEMDGDEQAHLLRNYIQEDMNAELELRRVIDDHSGSIGSDSEQSVIIEPSGALEEIRVRGRDRDVELVERETIEEENLGASMKMSGESEKTEAVYNRETEAAPEKLAETQVKEESQRRASSSSSRRSSVEAELGRLKGLPLKVGQEALEEIANFEADTLTSSIITDCLGNISRANSPPTPFNKEEEELLKQSEEKEKSNEIDSEMASIPPTPTGGARRRSVINIGDKMDVIYHDIGIEIEHAPPSDSDSEENDSDGANEADEKLPDTLRKLSDVTEASQEDDNQTELPEELSRTEQELELNSNQIESHKGLDSQKNVAQRRASSPPSPTRAKETDGILTKREIACKRIGSFDYDSSRKSIARKKVFNGYDLDEMKEHFRKLRELSLSTNKTRSDDIRKLRDGTTFRSKPKKRLRSKLPLSKYKVSVNLSEIRERWNYIKTRERIRKRDQELKWTGGIGEHSPNDLRRVDSSGMAKSQPNLTKKAKEEREEISSNSDDELMYTLLYELNLKCRCEQTKDSKHRGAYGKSGQARSRQIAGGRWCQKRVVRIVDVRTLKRTISLPESIIYSNDLLKRFNILKL